MYRRLLAVITVGLVGVSLLPQAASATESARVNDRALTCNIVGDGSANDCIRQRNVRDVADGVLSTGERLSMRAQVHPDLVGVTLNGQVQLRLLDRDGNAKSPWVTARTFTWTPGAREASVGKRAVRSRHLSARPASLPGIFQVRLQVVPAKRVRAALVSSSLVSSSLLGGRVRADEPIISDPTTLIAGAEACVEANGQDACIAELPPCAASGTCGLEQEPLPPDHLQDLALCESAVSCQPPPRPDGS